MELHTDFTELLALFNDAGIEYLLVGGYALAAHGRPRYTGDLDIFVRPTPENADRVIRALKTFGFGSVGLTVDDFQTPHRVVQLGFEPWRIDLMTSIAGVTWEEAASSRHEVDWGVRIPVIGRAELIRNKRSTARPQDLLDAEQLDAP